MRVVMFIMLSLVYHTVVSTSGIGSTCAPTKNPFLTSLAAQGVKLLPTAVSHDKHCKSEWSGYGTCCDVNDLIEYTKKESSDFESKNKKLAWELNNLNFLVGWNVYMVSTIKDFKPIKTLENGKKVKTLSPREIRIKEFSKFSAIFHKNWAILFIKKGKCIKKMNELRSASHCGTCSGRSEIFFNEGKAKMKESKCLQVIDQCHSYWNALIEIFEKLASISHLVARTNSRTSLKAHTTQSEYMSEWLKHNKITESLKKCKSSKACTLQQADSICRSLVSITNEKDFVSQSTSFLKEQAQDIKNEKKGKKVTSRILEISNFNLGLNSVFMTSDVCVVPDMGPLGSTAMNFDVQFP